MILDTNAISAFFDGVPALTALIGAAERLAVPSIALGEYRFGLLGSRIRSKGEANLGRLERLAEVLVVDASTAKYYAEVRQELKSVGRPIPENDLWIAALVRQYGLPLLGNDRHFAIVGEVTRIGW